MVSAFSTKGVGAAGPRSNFVSGPQLVTAASYGSAAELRRFARSWSIEHRGEISYTDRLVGFCLAVRRDLFEEVGRFDEGYGIGGFEDDDLCQRLIMAGHRLVICNDSFVHHEGHKTFDANGLDWMAEQESNRDRFESAHRGAVSFGRPPLVSACLIVKDEQNTLPDCLRSLQGLADEVILYDTGSTDRTVEIAREMGSVVVEGYWDDDFSRARNDALEHCRGEWVVWLDADETLQMDDPRDLRALLERTRDEIDAWSVRIQNLTGTGVGSEFTHHAARIFRRSRCEWTGRIHEQIARRGDLAPIYQAELEKGAWIRHTGYLDEALAGRNKAERNLRVAQAEVDAADGWDKGHSVVSLGRSLLLAGRPEEATSNLLEGLDLTHNGISRRLAIRSLIDATVRLGHLDEALVWCHRLRQEGSDPNTADAMEATVRVAREDWDQVLELLGRVTPSRSDADGFAPAAGLVAAQKARAFMSRSEHGKAADALLTGLNEDGVLDTHLGSLVECMQASGRNLTELASAIPADRITLFMAQVLQLHSEIADQLLEATMAVRPDPTPVLAAAATLATKLPLERAIIWSQRLRQAGHDQVCPLIALSRKDPDPVIRARAASVARQAFGDARADESFISAYSTATPAQRATISAEATQLCPTLMEEVSARTKAGVGRPRVTVVIPCYNHAELTIVCLQSLQHSTDPRLYEVVLVDNGSTDSTSRLSEVADDRFKVIRNDKNTGFGPACNQGAAAGSTEYVCFLNNDTILKSGWLEPLIAALDEDPRLGAVQPRLIYPDGRMNDAGGLVFRDGEPWVYGKGHPDPSAPEFSARRAPDYASGACLLVRRSAFVEVGGFDSCYAPAYYEDTDLSFALRSRGWKVMYEPASTVVHVEGGTAGTDTSAGLKQYQVRNAARFAEKWADELQHRQRLDPGIVEEWAHRPLGGFGPGEVLDTGNLGVPRNVGVAKRILVIDLTMPVFDRASGSLRLFHLLRTLRQDGHAVTFYSYTGGDRRYAEELGRFGITCYGADPRRLSDESHRSLYQPELTTLLSRRHFDLMIVSPWNLGEAVVPTIRSCSPASTVVLDTNDVHFLRLDRAARLSGDPADVAEANDTRRRELAVYRQVDRIVAVSEPDGEVLRAELPGADIVVIPNAHELPDPGPGFSERGGALFVGNFNHLPNRDAIEWWAEAIRPLLSRNLPGTDLTVVGNDPDGFAAGMAGPGIKVAGTVPSTLPHLHRARVSVAPLRYGAGMKGKVGEALAAGVPVVGTSVAAEGLGLTDGRNILIADSPEEFSAAVARLHTDESLWDRMREAGSRHIAENFGLERMRLAVKQLTGETHTFADEAGGEQPKDLVNS